MEQQANKQIATLKPLENSEQFAEQEPETHRPLIANKYYKL